MKSLRSSGVTTLAPAPARPALVQLAAFRVGELEYALDIMTIRAIINPLPIVRVPKLPAFIEGVIELRGEVLPVMDLRRRFEVPIAPVTRATKIILLRFGAQAVGAVVDAVSEVVRRGADEIRPAPALTAGPGARMFQGVLPHHGKTLIVLSAAELLTPEERAALDLA